MSGRRMFMDSPALEAELLTLKNRVDELEEEVRTLTAANLALVRGLEHLQRVSARSAFTG
ncbi:hypothetical protein HII36_38635 [Nonomuraea sp. NN258]|uniref:hypothetical protein n=1 Tax=Nonomuraea antri TaxID=2730852 RepID=UPI001567F6E2|nr:hypothetical protein [Nonomuraea antri]NRQ37706.1 hypothetical protein [Nonomuraea antri]